MEESITNGEMKVIEYVESIEKNGIAQHTPEWLAAKRNVIGGSQIGCIIGQGYSGKSDIDIILEKLGYSQKGPNAFGGPEKMNWGNLFEDTIKYHVERIYNTYVYGDNVFIPCTTGPLANMLAYSPDGLCAISNKVLIERHGKMHDMSSLKPNEESIVLLEFKAPYSRIINLRKVPEYYVSQPLLGLDMIRTKENFSEKRLCSLSLFIECSFRVCHEDDIGHGRLHSGYPSINPESTPHGLSHCHGFVYVFGPTSCPVFDKILDKFGQDGPDNQLCLLDKKTLDTMVNACIDGPLVTLHSGPFKTRDALMKRKETLLSDPATSASSLKNDISGLTCYGTLYWKLLDFSSTPIFPDTEFLERHESQIKFFNESLLACRELPGKMEVLDYLEERYGVDTTKYM